MTGWGYALADRRSREQRDAMDSPTFVKRVAELSGVDKEIAERVVRATLLNLGTRIRAMAPRVGPTGLSNSDQMPHEQ
jgi:type IV secretory pathway ATPase VirB11/archaellum biosynthesis ATPase